MVDPKKSTMQPDETSVDSLFQERAVNRDNEEFAKAKPILFRAALVLALFLLGLLYFLNPVSRVEVIAVRGADFLSRDYVSTLSRVTEKSIYYFVIPKQVESRLMSDPVIETASVKLETNNLVSITITEKEPIGYRYNEDKPMLVFSDGSTCELKSEYMSILSRVPYISGFTEEQQNHLLTQAFQKLDRSTIESMAEVNQYDLGYTDEAIEVLMRTGGYFFADYYSLSTLNSYEEIYQNMKDQSRCLYAYEADSDGNQVAVERACPWNETVTEREYWTDSDGNYIYDKWGDKAVKHYYQSSDGYYLDASGNKIVIPIDENGNDVEDPDFLDHYLAGYYDSGTLVIPDENSTSSEESTDSSGTSSDSADSSGDTNG